MIPRIKKLEPLENYRLFVVFDDGTKIIYDVKEDIENIPDYSVLITTHGLFNQVQLDQSRTCIFWNDYIDLPSDAIYEYGSKISE